MDSLNNIGTLGVKTVELYLDRSASAGYKQFARELLIGIFTMNTIIQARENGKVIDLEKAKHLNDSLVGTLMQLIDTKRTLQSST